MATHSAVVVDAERAAVVDETGDSCISRPYDRATDDYCTTDLTAPVIEVKWENFPDVKLEDVHGNNMEYQYSFVKVRACAVYILFLCKYAGCHDVLPWISEVK